MSRWKSTDAKPKTRFCWLCSRQLHGRQHSEIDGPDGHKHDVHKSCAKGPPSGYETWDDYYRENDQGGTKR